jgi:Pvc16 N-terminal domain
VIGKTLGFLRQRLDAYVRAELAPGDDPVADKVVFLDGDKMDPITFQEGAITELLINVEEERQLRAPDPYLRIADDGKLGRKQPDLRLSLNILFIARFKQYDLAWDYLTKTIEYLQTNRVFERATTPDLPAGVDRLSFELMTQSFAEQNDIWNALRTTYLPSALYRARLVILQDVKPTTSATVTLPVVVDVRRIS